MAEAWIAVSNTYKCIECGARSAHDKLFPPLSLSRVGTLRVGRDGGKDYHDSRGGSEVVSNKVRLRSAGNE